MKREKRWMGLALCLFLASSVLVAPNWAAEAPAMVVGRIYHIEGDLLRYIPAEKDWVPVVRDAPFGIEDTLFSGSRGMAELIAPNGTWIRIGNSTQIQFITLDEDLAEIDVASGMARFYNKSSDTVIKAASPFGYVLGDPGTVFDFYVGENSVEVVAVKGKVSFVHSATETKYDAAAGSPSILADQQQVSSGDGSVDDEWSRWNTVREDSWAAKARVRGRSVEYLPPSLHDESYALEENGTWESVPYEGTSRWLWRPRVAVGWSPFTVGRWTDWSGDQTWIPAEPFGYVTHHYGNWIYARNYWYWAPPVASLRVGLPLLDVGFYWYPGRVSWIHRGIYVGWVPLAPRETYYSHRYWGGPHTVVVNNVNITRINVNVRNFAYANRAVVVNQKNFYGVNNYSKVRVTNINPTTIINNYQAAPVVNNTVINNYTTIKQRYNHTNVPVKEKPHNTVINRIRQNETIIHEGKKEKGTVVQQRVRSIPEGKISGEARIEAPKVTNHIVPAGEINRPKSQIKLQQKVIKNTAASGKSEQQPKQPAAQSERAAPARPSRPEKNAPFVKPEQARPAKPDRPEQPSVQSERAAPARPSQPEKNMPPAKPEQARPAKPDRSVQPAAQAERVPPARPSRPEKNAPPAKPEQARPAKPDRPEQPAVQSERVTPERAAPERAAPLKTKEMIKPPERESIEKPKVKPLERDIEKPKDSRTLESQKQQSREQIPAQKQIDKPKKPSTSEKDREKQKLLIKLGEEEEKLKE